MERVAVAETGCWLWLGNTYPNGYPQVAWDGTNRLGHRVFYTQLVGPIPEGLHLDHLCRTPLCVNPDHLEPVTKRENERRGMCGVLKTHCIHGHEYTLENTYRPPGRLSSRACRACMQDRHCRRRRS